MARSATSVASTVLDEVQGRNVPFMASSIAYQAFVSLIPLLVLTFFLVSVVGDEGLATQVAEATEGVLPESGQELLADAIAGSVATTGASVIGLVTLLWGSLKIFRGLDTAFSVIYDSTGEGSFLEGIRDAFVVFVALALALAAAASAGLVFAFFPGSLLLGVLNPLLLVVGLTVAFVPMYYYFPDVEVAVREVLPGAVVAAVGWAALEGLFQLYVALASGSDSAGAIGAILLLLTWLYFGGLVLLVGAVVNAVVAGRLPADDEPAVEGSAVGPANVAGTHERRRLERRVETAERESDLLANDLHAQRSRRFRLEDHAATLERRVAVLERENERLRRQFERRRTPGWRRGLRRVLERARVVSIGTVREE